ncbi:MAG: hypothetical protein QGI68_12585, partial [Pseudomonadales bacterium]|nr:hypothetical protein [Pseudomonadales bacterium]
MDYDFSRETETAQRIKANIGNFSISQCNVLDSQSSMGYISTHASWWCTVLSVILYSTDLLLELWSCGREINECGQTVGWWEPLIHGLSIRP